MRIFAPAVERLEDLDPLLDADRQVADLGVRVDLEAELAWPAARIRPSDLWTSRKTGFAIVSLPSTMFSATREHRHEHEVLVDHADAARDRVGRPG